MHQWVLQNGEYKIKLQLDNMCTYYSFESIDCIVLRPSRAVIARPDITAYGTVYPKKYAHGLVVLCFVVVMHSFIMNSHEAFFHIHQGCFADTGAIVRLPQCQWSKPAGYGKISQCITTTKHSKAKTLCIFLGIYCMQQCIGWDRTWNKCWSRRLYTLHHGAAMVSIFWMILGTDCFIMTLYCTPLATDNFHNRPIFDTMVQCVHLHLTRVFSKLHIGIPIP